VYQSEAVEKNQKQRKQKGNHDKRSEDTVIFISFPITLYFVVEISQMTYGRMYQNVHNLYVSVIVPSKYTQKSALFQVSFLFVEHLDEIIAEVLARQIGGIPFDMSVFVNQNIIGEKLHIIIF